MPPTAISGKTGVVSHVVALVFIALGILADQASKLWVLDNLPGNEREVVPGFIAFQYAENRNMAFGLGKVIPPEFKVPVLVALTGILAAILLVWLFRARDLWMRAGLVLTVGGAIGNIIDRVRLGFVVDFIRWHKWFEWPNFNVADSFICVGVGILLVASFRAPDEGAEAPDTKKNEAQPSPDEGSAKKGGC